MNADQKKLSLSTLIPFVKKYQKWLWVSVIFSIIVGLIDISLAILSQHLLDRVVDSAQSINVLPLVYALLSAITLGVICKYWVKHSSVQFSANVLRNIRYLLFQKFASIPVSTVEERHSGELSSRMNNDASSLEQVLENKCYEYVYYPIVFVCAFVYLVQINWQLLLFSIVLMPTSTYLIGRLAKPLDRLAVKVQSGYSEINSSIQDTTGGVTVVKAYNLQSEFIMTFSSLLKRLFGRTLQVEKRKAWMEPINTIQIWGTYFICTIYSAYLTAAGYISVGELLVFLVLINQLIHPINALPGLISNYKLTMAAVGRIAEVLAEKDERSDGKRLETLLSDECFSLNEDPTRYPKGFYNVLEMRNVSFAYEIAHPVLQNINFSVGTGRMLAIVGPSGSGKSTLLQLLCSFQQPQAGEILLYGEPINNIALTDIRSHISLVAQDSYLFPGTVADNLRIANMQATMEQIIEAAQAANAHEFIEKLPHGYHTKIEERGANFSGGQKQRIAIARALLKKAPILLLDEPTAALDKNSEELIQQSLEVIKKDHAVVVIAHRLSTIINADHIIVLNQGTIVEQGTHQQLLQLDGLYTELFRHQQIVNQPLLEQEEVLI